MSLAIAGYQRNQEMCNRKLKKGKENKKYKGERDHICIQVYRNIYYGSLWKIMNNCIPSKDRNTLTYARDTSLVADEFNHYFTSVGSSTALAAEKIANDHNLQLTDPLTRTSLLCR
jgi:hypothetical protein